MGSKDELAEVAGAVGKRLSELSLELEAKYPDLADDLGAMGAGLREACFRYLCETRDSVRLEGSPVADKRD